MAVFSFSEPAFLKLAPPPALPAAVLCALLFAALPLAFSLPVSVTLVFTALLLLRALLLHVGIGRLPAPLLAALAVAAGALVWTQLGSVFGREGGTAFLLLMIVLKTFESRTRRDWHVLLLSTLFLIGAATLLNPNLLTGVWLLLALPAVALCLGIANHLHWRESLRRTLWGLAVTLPLAAVLFTVVPRMNEPLWRIPQSRGDQASTGLSNEMQPGSVSNLVQSNEWVANVVFSDGQHPAPEQLYWRAIIMSRFDGTRWTADSDQAADNAQPPQGKAVSYQIITRDQQGVLPALDQPAAAAPTLAVRQGNVLRTQRSREGLRRLQLQAVLSDTLPQALSEAEYRRYTALPANNPKTRLLAERLARQSGNPRDYIRRSLDYFRQQKFRYTLQPPRFEGRDSVDEFMFGGRQGFCEHYAQSFAIMMRAAGLPARIVTGYLGAEYNADAGFWQIRSKDAHAWTEVWLPDEQAWLRVDPTAAVSSQRSSAGISQALPESEQTLLPNENAFSKWRDVGQFYFQQWVLNYDHNRQNTLFAKLGLGGFNLKTLLLVLPVALLLALWPLWRSWRRSESRDPLQHGFDFIRQHLLGHDHPDRHTATAAELMRELPPESPLQALLAQYENWRYGGGTPAPAEVKRWLRQVRRVLKNSD